MERYAELAGDMLRGGFRWKEIAQLLGINVNTLKYHYHKADPRYREARQRAWAKWSPKRRAA